jgi:hypothetical protein
MCEVPFRIAMLANVQRIARSAALPRSAFPKPTPFSAGGNQSVAIAAENGVHRGRIRVQFTFILTQADAG